jgi:hypothetical protein
MKKYFTAALERIANRRLFFGLGAAGATSALSSFFGISLVVHSSGGLLLTAGSGYIAGTFISAGVVALATLLLPFTLAIGLIIWFRKGIVAVFDWMILKLYFWRNPEQ